MKKNEQLCSFKFRPLPRGLTIKKSDIEGLGLFTELKIFRAEVLGPSHIKLNETSLENNEYIAYFHDNGILRTPLGGWINHSEEPNVGLRDAGAFYVVEALRDIKPGEELTVDYRKGFTLVNSCKQ